VDTADVLYGAGLPLLGNQGHMVTEHDLSLGANQDQDPHHQLVTAPLLIPHLQGVQVMISLGLCLLVLMASKVWFPTEMPPQILWRRGSEMYLPPPLWASTWNHPSLFYDCAAIGYL
jgi:hypothetical protein